MINLTGRPVPKKNNGRIVRCGGKWPKVLPSAAFCKYQDDCLNQLANCHENYEGYLWVKAEYWLPDKKWWPDLGNLINGTHDILQKAGIYKNDKAIVSVDGSRIVGLSKKNPRAEITITPVEYELEVEE